MAQMVREIMTRELVQLPVSSTVTEAAKRMRESEVGGVIVHKDGKVCGIVTDRDIVVRVLGAGRDPNKTSLEAMCSAKLTTVSPEDDVDRLPAIMRENAVRRVPVIDDKGQAVGIVSLGDLARHRDPKSVLGTISAAPANR
jgi:CBS domain-containing protein